MFTARMRWARVHRPDQVRARSTSSFFAESISDAIKGLDCIKLWVGAAEFSADPLDMAVDRAVIDIHIVLIGDVEQLVARLHHSGPLGERLQDQKFGDGQSDILAVPF